MATVNDTWFMLGILLIMFSAPIAGFGVLILSPPMVVGGIIAFFSGSVVAALSMPKVS